MLAGMADNSVPAPLANLRNLKADGKVKIHCCGTAGKVGRRRTRGFVDVVDDIVGIAQYISDCEEADVVQVL